MARIRLEKVITRIRLTKGEFNREMSIPEISIKRKNLEPFYEFHLTDSLGNDIDVSSATSVLFSMVHPQSHTVIVSGQDVVFAGNSESAITGEGHYTWVTSDTSTSGKFTAEVQITPGSGQGSKFTLPAEFNNPSFVNVNSSFIDG